MNPSLIAKIQKLRTLAQQSSNLHEAKAAAEAAARLIEEHRIAEAELEAPGDGASAIVTEVLDTRPGNPESWRLALIQAISEHHGCADYFRRERARVPLGRGRSRIQTTRVEFRIAGRPSDIEAARYLYTWLTTEIERLCAASKHKGRAARTSFRLGAVVGFEGALTSARTKTRAAATEAQSAALVRLDARAVEAAKHLPGSIQRHDPRTMIDPGAFVAGIRSGRSIHVGDHLGERGEPKRLGDGKDQSR